MIGSYLLICCVLGLRGNKGFLVERESLMSHFRFGLEDIEHPNVCGIPQAIMLSYPQLIEEDIEVLETFSAFRSLRRGSTSRAEEVGVSDSIIDANNR